MTERQDSVSMRRQRSLCVGLSLCLLAVAAGCTRGRVSTSAGSTDGSSPGGGTASGAPFDGQFGTMTTPVCGPAPSAESADTTVPSGPTSGLNVQGVTADTIRVGTVADVGYAGVPGLNQELFDASEVFVDWCNDLGGINGHKIQLDRLDSAVLNYKPIVLQACDQDFALVGGGAVFDDAGELDRLSCLLPNFPGIVVTPKATGADLTVEATGGLGPAAVNVGLGRYLSATFPDSIDRVGYLTGSLGTLVTNKEQFEEAGRQYGWQTVYSDQYNTIGEPTWAPFAQAIKDKGVRGLYWIGEPTYLGRLLTSLAQIDYKLDWIAAATNEYDPKLIEGAGVALDLNNVYIQDGTTPFVSTQVPAVMHYEALFDKYLPNGKSHASLGENAFAAWLLFAQAAKSCGATITRLCVYGAARAVTAWDSGGLSSKLDLSTPLVPSECFVGIKATGQGFSVIDWEANDGPYNCDPANIATLTPRAPAPAKLSDVGRSLGDLGG